LPRENREKLFGGWCQIKRRRQDIFDRREERATLSGCMHVPEARVGLEVLGVELDRALAVEDGVFVLLQCAVGSSSVAKQRTGIISNMGGCSTP
jgi:hypothetical protein